MRRPRGYFRRLISRITILVILALVIPYVYKRIVYRVDAITVVKVATQPTTSLRTSVRMAAMNIAHGRGNEEGGSNWTTDTQEERLKRLDKIAELIRKQDLDIVVLNEVDFQAVWSGQYDQALHIAQKSGLPYVMKQNNFDVSIPFFSFTFGNAVLSRYPITSYDFIDYPGSSFLEKYLAGAKHGSICMVKPPRGPSIKIIPIHLDHEDEATRIKSIQKILPHINSQTVLIGDFNSYPGNKSAMDYLFATSRHKPAAGPSVTSSTYTYPSPKPKKRLDWIIAPAHWSETLTSIVPTKLSDHAFLISEYER